VICGRLALAGQETGDGEVVTRNIVRMELARAELDIGKALGLVEEGDAPYYFTSPPSPRRHRACDGATGVEARVRRLVDLPR
jgi:hypothetical protein